jgi:hypothetical protein
METVNFLGISIVGQSSARGDNGIYVAQIMAGGAVALDGRIEVSILNQTIVFKILWLKFND